MAEPEVNLITDEVNPEPLELLAKSIIQISDGFQKLLDSPLNQRALILLLHDAIGQGRINKVQIKLVLDSLPRLKEWYVKNDRDSSDA